MHYHPIGETDSFASDLTVGAVVDRFSCRGYRVWVRCCAIPIAATLFAVFSVPTILAGMSVLEMIRKVRFENAKVLLETTEKPIALVGELSGSLSVTTFCREFKAETGLSPAAWRRKSRL